MIPLNLPNPKERKLDPRDQPKRNKTSVGTVEKEAIEQTNVVQKQRKRKSIFLTWIRRRKVNFSLSLMNHFLTFQMNLKKTAQMRTTMIQILVNQKKVALARKHSALAEKNLRLGFFLITQKKPFLMSYNISMMMRLGIVSS